MAVTILGIFKNTSNSLTGASASSAGAIHYATTLPPSNPMPMARPRAHGTMKVGRMLKYAPGVFKAHLRSVALGRTKRGGGKKKAHKKHHVRHHRHRDHNAQEDSILQEIVPQVIRHVDCQLYFNIMWNRYKAVIYLNGVKVKEMFDFSLPELKERLRLVIDQLGATSSTPLNKAVQWMSMNTGAK